MIDNIKDIYFNNKKVIFKIYGVEYTIEEIDSKVVIYQTNNSKRQRTFNSIDDLLNNYTIYGETIIDNERSIKITN